MRLAVRTPLHNAEKVRKELLEKKLIDFSRIPRSDETYFYLPVKSKIESYEIVEIELDGREEQDTFRAELEKILPEDTHEFIKTAYDLVGDIAIIEVDPRIQEYDRQIGEILLNMFSNIKVIVRKEGGHEGELRLQEYKHLAGKERFDTQVIESGVRLRLDIRKTYYSVRSSTERQRISHLVHEGERVLVMFSGIAPFVIVIAKHAQPSEVIGVELNADAHEFAQENIVLNKVDDVSEVMQGDARIVVPTLGTFDRIVMPLPHTADDFLDVAIGASREGTNIHLYHFSSEDEIKEFANAIPNRLENVGALGEVTHLQKCGSLAPGIFRWSVDIVIASLQRVQEK